ncbi:MAG: prenyltransferase/squalene oxidase repeat-containing protein [Planctomycetaceae bacterium]
MSRLILIAVLASTAVVPACAQTKSRRDVDRSGRRLVTAETDKAINKGLKWLADQQNGDGSFGSVGGLSENVGVTSLAGLAFVASGSTPDRGPYGKQVSGATDYLLSRAQPGGLILSPDSNQPMYGHGFATLFLAEIYGMVQRKDLRPKLSRAIKLIIASQNKDGGWRYTPQARDADVSVTVCQMMALRAARNAGFAVPRETVDKCVLYLRKCQNEDGGFRYQLESARESMFPRSAAAVVGLYSAGIYSGKDVSAGLNYLNRFQPSPTLRINAYYFYGHYYGAQAMWQAGGKHWFDWYPAIRDDLLRSQSPEGRWRDTQPSVGSRYATAMALLVLQTPNNLLPIFQR